MQVGAHPTFSQIQQQFEPGKMTPGRLANKQLRFDAANQLHTHSSSPFKLSGKGKQAAIDRAQKHADGAAQVKAAIDRQYPPGTADRVFANILRETGRDLSQGVRRSDLATIQQAIILDRAGVPANDPLLQHLGVEKYTSRLEAVEKTIAKAGGNDHGLTPSEKVALYSYTSTDDCYTINRFLRQTAGNLPEGSAGKMMVDLMKSGLDKLPDVPGKSFRGVGAMPLSVVRAYQDAARAKGDDKIITEHAFVSTSASNGKSFQGGYQFSINGDHGKDVSAFSKHDEREVLYPPGTRFVVTKIDGSTDISGLELGGRMHIMMKEAREG